MIRHLKSERLKKLESELKDLEEWLRLELVPKRDIPKHKDEIQGISTKIKEEKERLRFLKESGEIEEYITPKRPVQRAGYAELTNYTDMEMNETTTSETTQDTSFGMESEATVSEAAAAPTEEAEEEGNVPFEEEESYFSDRNRWKRGGIVDPDADEW